MKTIEVKFQKPVTYEEATGLQTWYYNHLEHPIDSSVLADKLNDYFTETEGREVSCFVVGKPRLPGELAVSIRWPKWREDRKPIKTKLQEGVTLTY